jgi:hypothetical protein
MTNEEFQKIITTLKSDLRIYAEMMHEVALDIVKQGFSKYPMFIATEAEIKMGELILDRNDYAATFSIYASTMEEMLERGLIQENKKQNFVSNYKDPRMHMCVLLVTNGIASIVFYPYQSNEQLDKTDE